MAMGAAAWLTASVALRAQTAANAADVAVGMFLLIGVLSSARPPDDSHPLGYGRDRFFWSLFAALGIFVGGGGLALEGAVSAALHPAPADHYAIAYAVLIASAALDSFALAVALRPLRRQACARHVSLHTLVRGSTDPASMTVVVGGGCAVIGAFVAMVGLMVSQLTGSPTADTVAGALIGLLLLSASAILLHTNRELLVGRGVPLLVLREMRGVVAAQPGVVDVPDLFAVVVGPSSLIVDGDVTFADELDVPAVERTIICANAALRARWPTIDFVYLTPVARARPRRNQLPRAPSLAHRREHADGNELPSRRT
jgi:cation diffusion facilitator family transporter